MMKIKKLKTPVLFISSFFVLAAGFVLLLQTGELNTQDLSNADFKTTLLPYRLFAYVAILAAWKPISRFISRPRMHREDITPEIKQKWDELSMLLFQNWWKLALFFALFEIFAIQKLGFLL